MMLEGEIQNDFSLSGKIWNWFAVYHVPLTLKQ